MTWIKMKDFCQLHKIEQKTFKKTMEQSKLAGPVVITYSIKNGKQVPYNTTWIPTELALSKNVAKRTKSSIKQSTSWNKSTYEWREAYINKVFKVHAIGIVATPNDSEGTADSPAIAQNTNP